MITIIILIVIYIYKKKKRLFPYLSYIIFGNSCRLDLKDINSFDEYLKKLNNKKRKDLKRIIRMF